MLGCKAKVPEVEARYPSSHSGRTLSAIGRTGGEVTWGSVCLQIEAGFHFVQHSVMQSE